MLLAEYAPAGVLVDDSLLLVDLVHRAFLRRTRLGDAHGADLEIAGPMKVVVGPKLEHHGGARIDDVIAHFQRLLPGRIHQNLGTLVIVESDGHRLQAVGKGLELGQELELRAVVFFPVGGVGDGRGRRVGRQQRPEDVAAGIEHRLEAETPHRRAVQLGRVGITPLGLLHHTLGVVILFVAVAEFVEPDSPQRRQDVEVVGPLLVDTLAVIQSVQDRRVLVRQVGHVGADVEGFVPHLEDVNRNVFGL